MTIMEVWEALPDIHREIFEVKRKSISRIWIDVCTLSTTDEGRLKRFERDREGFLRKKTDIAKMQAAWKRCFGNGSPSRADLLVRYMMLFMIFGEAMADPMNEIFINNHLEKLLDKVPPSGDRRWALDQCLGDNISLRNAKAQISAIIEKVGH